jgi:aspartyl-tRNA(Asn)/glutamyl-tRNA(Gln) amidotransferase subunit C
LQVTRHVAKREPDDQEARMAIDTDTARKVGILGFMEQLNEVDVTGVEPMTSVTPMRLKRRADVVTDGDMQAAILKNAPDAREGFFAVPKVVE